MPLLQPDIEKKSEPHPITLMSDHIFDFIGSDPDNMQLEDHLSQPERAESIKSTEKELQYHIKRGHWKVIPTNHMPKGNIPLLMVWSMKRKMIPIG